MKIGKVKLVLLTMSLVSFCSFVSSTSRGENLMQDPLKSTLDVELDGAGDSQERYITSEGGVEFKCESTAKWCKIEQISETSVRIFADRNPDKTPRKAQVNIEIVKDKKMVQSERISVTQKVAANYKLLGKGYDTTGEYANEGQDVKAQILDLGKLEKNNQIAIIEPRRMEEYTETGETLDEYVKKISNKLKVEGNYKGFTGSVAGSFSEETYLSKANSFGKTRGVATMEIINLHADLKGKELQEYLTKEANADINGAKPADQVVSRYGTHVMTGIVMGASIDYFMSANKNSSTKAIEWGVAVEAGYKTAVAGVTVGNDYQQYDNAKNHSSNFYEKQIVKGGDAAYFSRIAGDKDTQKKWLESIIKEPGKWKLVDYTDNGLIPIWELANSSKRSDEIKRAVIKYATDKADKIKQNNLEYEISMQHLYNIADYRPYDYAYIDFDVEILVNGESKAKGTIKDVSASNNDTSRKAGFGPIKCRYIHNPLQANPIEVKITNGHGHRGANNKRFNGTLHLKYDITGKTWKASGENAKVTGNENNWHIEFDCRRYNGSTEPLVRYLIDIKSTN